MRKVDLGPDEEGPKWPFMSDEARVADPRMFCVGKQNSPEHPCERCGSTSTCDCPVGVNLTQFREYACVVCGKAYVGGRLYTCSQACHERLVGLLVEDFGEFKRVVDAETGKAYRVPTRDIIEKGLRHADLVKYPEWKP